MNGDEVVNTRGAMMSIAFTDEDLVRLEIIDMDRDAEEALKFLRERILSELKRQKGQKMKGSLDGGKGSIL